MERTLEISVCLWLILIFTAIYFLISFIAINFFPIPMKKVKDGYIKMMHPDYWLHYLEIASITHAFSTIFLGFYWIWESGYEFDHQTTYWEYICIWNSLAYFIEDLIVEIYYKAGDAGVYAHHVFSILLMYAALNESYSGMAMAGGLFYGELTNPFFWYRNCLKRTGYEFTTTYQVWFWFYAIVYYLCRGAMFSYNTYYIVISMTIPFYIKCVCLPNLFLSHGWMFLLSRALWKNIPYWFSDPKSIQEKEWWIKGRLFLKKYTKDAPMVYYICIFIAIYSCLIPISIAYYLKYVSSHTFTSEAI